jgi:peptide subunit release factor 1 (eRF1)
MPCDSYLLSSVECAGSETTTGEGWEGGAAGKAAGAPLALHAGVLEDIDLRELAQVQSHELAVVSVYLTGPEGLGVLDRRETAIHAMLADDATAREQFDETMKQVRQVLEENPVTGEGLALFACWALNFLKGFQLSVKPKRDILRIGATPFIRPLAEMQEEHEPFLVVTADSQTARILQVVSAEVQDEERVRGDVKNRVKKGGWSQQRYARRRKNQLHHYTAEIAEVLERLAREEGFKRIVLLGADETMREIEEQLPRHVAALVVGKKPVNLGAGEESTMEEAWSLYFEEERASEQRLWDEIREQFFAGGLAVAGPADVLEAAGQGRVETALVDRELRLPATQCRKCAHVAPSPEGEISLCPACGSDDLFEVSLVNTLVAHLERSSAEVDFTDPFPALTELGGMAALLRY